MWAPSVGNCSRSSRPNGIQVDNPRSPAAVRLVGALAIIGRGHAIDFNWLATMCGLADAIRLLDHREAATKLYDIVLPYAGRNAVMGGNVACYGSVGGFLGQLATLMKRFGNAEEHFVDALGFNRKLGARGSRRNHRVPLRRDAGCTGSNGRARSNSRVPRSSA